MKIEHTLSPNSQDVDFLTQKINEETPSFGTASSFAFFIRDTKNEIIAGCNGSIIFGAIYTDQLWVHPDYRRQGLAQKLMEKVHQYGREAGCTIATVATMRFQNARGFYENLGYQCDFERFGYIKKSSFLFLKMAL